LSKALLISANLFYNSSGFSVYLLKTVLYFSSMLYGAMVPFLLKIVSLRSLRLGLNIEASPTMFVIFSAALGSYLSVVSLHLAAKSFKTSLFLATDVFFLSF
jgi:hypothetical protein